MGKIKSLLENQKNSIREIALKYSVTIIAVILMCMIRVLLNVTGYNYWQDDMISKIFTFLGIFAVGSFFVETVLKTEGANTVLFWIGHVLNVVAAVILDIMCFSIEDIAGDKGELLFHKILYFYVILAIGISMYKIIRSSGLGFNKYSVSLVFGLIKVTSVFIVLNIGFIMLISIFDSLIFEIDVWDWIENIELLMSGFVYFPYALICLTDKKEKDSKFIRNFLMYALMPMVIAALVMVYVYVFKLLFTWNIPSNEVFGICLWVFIIGAIIWTMANAFVTSEVIEGEGKTPKYYLIIKYMKYIYSPLILLEMFSIGLRINEYGVTHERYYAVIAIAFQIIYVFWEPLINLISKVIKKPRIAYGEYYEGLIFAIIALYFICFLTPNLNCDYVSFKSQKNRFEKNIEKGDDYLDEISSGYRYLRYNVYGKEYLSSEYTKEELEAFGSIINGQYTSNNSHYTSESTLKYVRFRYNQPHIDISGYENLYYVEANYALINGSSGTLNELKLSYDNGKNSVVIDIEGLIDYAIDESMIDNYIDASEPFEIITEDGSKVCIKECSFKYSGVSGNIGSLQDLSIKAYVLTKN